MNDTKKKPRGGKLTQAGAARPIWKQSAGYSWHRQQVFHPASLSVHRMKQRGETKAGNANKRTNHETKQGPSGVQS